ncbi:hypothetical protein [Streptomyces sp. 3N207]|uniref:hypothetical protein n=1 Tax=Streptomyces sp. 3N207 TaxID=3457417 RepID=UPI003FD12594
MITAGLQPGAGRLRSTAGSLWTLALAALLLGLLYTHGAGAGGATGHLGGAVAVQPGSAQAGGAAAVHHEHGEHEGHEGHPDAAHHALECLAGPPQDGFVLDDPGPAPAPWTSSARDESASRPTAHAAGGGTAADAAGSGTATILRI